jgi:hypothetical protein
MAKYKTDDIQNEFIYLTLYKSNLPSLFNVYLLDGFNILLSTLLNYNINIQSFGISPVVQANQKFIINNVLTQYYVG